MTEFDGVEHIENLPTGDDRHAYTEIHVRISSSQNEVFDKNAFARNVGMPITVNFGNNTYEGFLTSVDVSDDGKIAELVIRYENLRV